MLITFVGDMNFDGLLNDHKMAEFVMTNSAGQVLSGDITFMNPEVIHDGTWEYINDVRVSDVLEAYKGLGNWASNKSIVFTGQSYIQGNVYVNNKVDGVSIRERVQYTDSIIRHNTGIISAEQVLEYKSWQCLNQQIERTKCEY